MKFKDFYKCHQALCQGLIAMLITPICAIPLFQSNAAINTREKDFFEVHPLVFNDSINLTIDLNNCLFNNLLENYEIKQYCLNKNNEFEKQNSLKIIDATRNNNNTITVQVRSKGYQKNKDIFIDNSFNKNVYISCKNGDEKSLEPLLYNQFNNFKEKNLLNKNIKYDKVVDYSKKLVLVYDNMSTLYKYENILDTISIYNNRFNDLYLYELNEEKSLFNEFLKKYNNNYLVDEEIYLINYATGLIQESYVENSIETFLKNKIKEGNNE